MVKIMIDDKVFELEMTVVNRNDDFGGSHDEENWEASLIRDFRENEVEEDADTGAYILDAGTYRDIVDDGTNYAERWNADDEEFEYTFRAEKA